MNRVQAYYTELEPWRELSEELELEAFKKRLLQWSEVKVRKGRAGEC